MKITEHFDSSEFKVSAQFPELAKDIVLLSEDLLKLFYICSCILEPARSLYKKPLLVLSGKRTPKLNKAIKGAENSDHLFFGNSCAVDPYMEDQEKLFGVYGWIYMHCFYSVGEAILYLKKDWRPNFIHISLPTKKHHSCFFFDYNKGKQFDVIPELPEEVFMKIFTEEAK